MAAVAKKLKVLVVLAHPEPTKSFNRAMFDTAVATLTKAGHEVKTSNLPELKFDPISDRRNFKHEADPNFFKQQQEETKASQTDGFVAEVKTEQEKILWCDLMIWQFPLWWFSVPALLKGWVDRVFAYGVIYGNGKFYKNGVCKGKKALLSVTTGGPAGVYEKGGWNGDINGVLRPIQRGMLEFTGWEVLKPHMTYGPAHTDDNTRKDMLKKWEERLAAIEKEEPYEVGAF